MVPHPRYRFRVITDIVQEMDLFRSILRECCTPTPIRCRMGLTNVIYSVQSMDDICSIVSHPVMLNYPLW